MFVLNGSTFQYKPRSCTRGGSNAVAVAVCISKKEKQVQKVNII